MSEEKIREAIKVECDRQHVGIDRQDMLYFVYGYLQNDHDYFPLTKNVLTRIAYDIEPDNGGKYRTTPVSFNGIVGGVNPSIIDNSMHQWIKWFNTDLSWIVRGGNVVVDPLIKEFLEIGRAHV